MASVGRRDNLTCSICKDIYKEPVTLPCGHNFCKDCIQRAWDNQDKGESTCSLCARRYKRKPELTKNVELANLSADFRWSWRETRALIGATCSYCIDRPMQAVKCCVPCKVSLCDNHLRIHSSSAGHIYIEPNSSLYSKKCSIHKKTLEFYCAEDTAYVCAYCRLEEKHRGHNVQSLDKASEKKKKELRNILEKLTPKIKTIDKSVKRLRQCRKRVQEKAAHTTATLTDLFRDIGRWMEDLEKQVMSEISRQEERACTGLSDLIQQMDIQMEVLSGHIRYIDGLCNMTDPLIVLQELEMNPLIVLQELEMNDICSSDGDSQESQEEVYAAGDLDEGVISQILHKGLADLVIHAKRTFSVQKASEIFLDINTAANDVLVEGLNASWSDIVQNRPSLPGRFESHQVLGSKGFTSGKHYWEVEMSPSGNWRVGITYASIQRTDHQSWIGNNKKSWCLMKLQDKCFVMHNSESISLPLIISTQKIRIYLDYESGELSFYELRNPIRHLHTFTATFTEPLHIAIWVWMSFVKMRSYSYLSC
ncbi:E3 ubiquitin/ISG15 ligase TRIM25-like [Mantella aurantiaca]